MVYLDIVDPEASKDELFSKVGLTPKGMSWKELP